MAATEKIAIAPAPSSPRPRARVDLNGLLTDLDDGLAALLGLQDRALFIGRSLGDWIHSSHLAALVQVASRVWLLFTCSSLFGFRFVQLMRNQRKGAPPAVVNVQLLRQDGTLRATTLHIECDDQGTTRLGLSSHAYRGPLNWTTQALRSSSAKRLPQRQEAARRRNQPVRFHGPNPDRTACAPRGNIDRPFY